MLAPSLASENQKKMGRKRGDSACPPASVEVWSAGWVQPALSLHFTATLHPASLLAPGLLL